MSDQVWEVVGGGNTGGLVVRIAREAHAPQFQERLSSGSLVVAVEIVGDRVLYNRIAGTGYGPDSGWVSLRQGARELLVPVDVTPPKGGWKVLSADLPEWTAPPPPAKPPPGMRALMPPSDGANALRADEDEPLLPQEQQSPGGPYVFYHQINFNDSKPTGLRMSACLAAMDELRTDSFTLCDQSVDSVRKVINPLTQLALELRPDILRLSSKDKGNRTGLHHAHPKSQGAVLSWLRLEALFGWPPFPLRTEEQTIYLTGKQKYSRMRTPLCQGRFVEAFVDDSVEPSAALSGLQWENDVDQFFAKVKASFSSDKLNERAFQKFYREGGLPFAPTTYKKVTWTMSQIYTDLWGVLYHPKTPELLWDLNTLAGDEFAQLVEEEPDPQAISVALPREMKVGERYEAFCFLEVNDKRAVYVLLPEGKTAAADCVLCVCARYDWASAPQDGKTIRSGDVEVCNALSRSALANYGLGKEPKPNKFLDLEKLPAL